MTLEEMLTALFEDRWPEDVHPYELNRALGWKPWTNLAVQLWAYSLKGQPLPHSAPGDAEAIRILSNLYDDYKTAREA